MKSLSRFSALALVALALAGCRSDAKVVNSGRGYATREVKIDPIGGVCTNTAIDIVYVQQSGSPYVRIKAPRDVLPYIRLKRHGNCLNVDFDDRRDLEVNGKCTVYVYAPEVTEFTANSAGSIQLPKGLNTKRDACFRVESAGGISGDEIRCRDLEVKVNSAGNVSFDLVSCGRLNVKLNSAGNFSTDDVSCRESRLICSSAGNVDVRQMDCSGRLEAVTHSAGNIRLAGTCGEARYQANSVGNIRAEKLKSGQTSVTLMSCGNVYCNTSSRLDVSRRTRVGRVYYKGLPSQINGGDEGVSRL